MIDDEKEKDTMPKFCLRHGWGCYCTHATVVEHIEDAPQEKQLTYMQDIQSIDRRMQKVIEQKTQPTSETYDQGRFIIVQDGDDKAFKNGNYYTAHLYFNSVQEWEIKEEYNTYLRRS